MTDRAERLAAYAELVRRWAPRLDLVSPRDLERFEERHIADCLRAADLVRGLPRGWCADVGSGAGLPGIPLAIAVPTHRWRLVEPRRRRAAFLEEVVRTLDLNCEVHALTAAEAAADPGLAAAHVLAAARALAPPAEAFDALLPLVAPGGLALVFAAPGARLPGFAEEWAPGLATIRRDVPRSRP